MTAVKSGEQGIGIFDSGLGGLSVLADLTKIHPGDEFHYYADTCFAPYGEKSRDLVQKRVLEVAEKLLQRHIRLLVIACNTATSAAVEELRQLLPIPVVGMEPALKPAVLGETPLRIVVAATPLTLKEKKFSALLQQNQGFHDIIPLPCPGLVEVIENAGPGSRQVDEKLAELLAPVAQTPIHRLVLGCTHYVLIRPQWQQAVGSGTQLVDGNEGTVRQALRLLSVTNEREKHTSTTRIHLMTSASGLAPREMMKHILHQQLLQRGLPAVLLEKQMQIILEEE
ncbi:glutamate racemase [Anoxynatronum buryatiense]|uniref:Glutamate racemase n=1 Tax=Anoxynatronum buryatiense TaxID=489973 RepID=A0AA46AHN6_9CLOT|nr:glutamate racemase [Anoxynatronum buryatiense]SMP41285.1 glutamate racemase [Anoxynatronum buryatiense]